MKNHFELLAAYNQTMNLRLYQIASQLDDTELAKDRGAFFGSILNTLNHIFTADTLWLKRFATHPCCQPALDEMAKLPNPSRLDQVFFEDFSVLYEQRLWLDRQIIHWIHTLSDADLEQVISYQTVKGLPANKQLSSLILHFFNHQTHHRGQVSTLLSQIGKDIGVTDLLAQIPEVEL